MAATDRTNYHLLMIVAIVALTAIVAMYVHGANAPSISPTVQFVDGTKADQGSALTGNVVADSAAAAPSRSYRRPEFDWGAYDYDGSGALDPADADVLASVIDRERFCPPNKICDINEDGVIDLSDLGSFNAKLLTLEMQRQSSRAALTGYVTATDAPTAAAGGADFWIATIGASPQ